ncbi:CAP domain-containing protein [Trichococcus sp.]|uniref:CAP domain-containing protein n=1 Tax=Trichococcus sp. TaxID=1985464 RepID=UPI003C7A4A4B
MRLIKGLLFTGIAALLVGYGINPTAFNEKFPFLEQAVQSDVTEKIKVLTSPEGVDLITAPFTRPDEIDYTLVEDKIMVLLNELRLEQGLLPLTKNETLKAAADHRAIETQTSFSHTRPDGTDFYTIILTDDYWYPYQTVGENLAMATYFKDEEGMAEFLFDGWVESEGHYANMIHPDFLEVGIGVHYDGEFLYAVQLFGKQNQ